MFVCIGNQTILYVELYGTEFLLAMHFNARVTLPCLSWKS